MRQINIPIHLSLDTLGNFVAAFMVISQQGMMIHGVWWQLTHQALFTPSSMLAVCAALSAGFAFYMREEKQCA